MEVIQPLANEQILARNALLQESLRPERLPFSIADEYPIVLSPENSHFSHCIKDGEQIVAHASLWPRIMEITLSSRKVPIGLIGNVATHGARRGEGLMQKLLTDVTRNAKRNGLKALVLWSDLIQFYQKLGFRALGQELRMCFNRNLCDKQLNQNHKLTFLVPNPNQLSTIPFDHLMELRPKLSVSLQRCSQEFLKLLQIPSTYLTLIYQEQLLVGYIVLGKGYDLMGCVHEWGATDSSQLLGALQHVLKHTQLNEVWLLSPSELSFQWRVNLSQHAVSEEKHSMAWGLCLDEDTDLRQSLDRLFVWGLDSI